MMRDKIADLLDAAELTYRQTGEGPNSKQMANIILDALPDMIPDLVWYEGTSLGYWFADDPLTQSKLDVYRAHPHRDGIGYWTYYRDFKTDVLSCAEQAKAAANAHHKAQVMTVLGLAAPKRPITDRKEHE